MEDPSPPLLRPIPRRPFEFARTATDSQPDTPGGGSSSDAASLSDAAVSAAGGRLSSTSRDEAPSSPTLASSSSRSRSILNLTSSTLFGIYAPTAFSDNTSTRDYSEPATPWGTGAETPSRNASFDVGSGGSGGGGGDSAARTRPQHLVRAASQQLLQQQQRQLQQQQQAQAHGRNNGRVGAGIGLVTGGGGVLPLAARVVALFAFGVLYGVLVSHLHDNRTIAPVHVQGLDHGSWQYLAFWGVAGVALGSLLPWMDVWLSGEELVDEDGVRAESEVELELEDESDNTGLGVRLNERGEVGGKGRAASEDRPRRVVVARRSSAAEEMGWSSLIRSVGAFVGIAFAIRKLPWRSTLQVSITLALVNPVLWYMLDRSRPGFLLSTLVGVAGSTFALLLNPEWVPSPTAYPGFYRSGNSSDYAGQRGQDELLGGLVSYESIGVATWIASVFFCSSICFGNIGRKLAMPDPRRTTPDRWRY